MHLFGNSYLVVYPSLIVLWVAIVLKKKNKSGRRGKWVKLTFHPVSTFHLFKQKKKKPMLDYSKFLDEKNIKERNVLCEETRPAAKEWNNLIKLFSGLVLVCSLTRAWVQFCGPFYPDFFKTIPHSLHIHLFLSASAEREKKRESCPTKKERTSFLFFF